jgi:integrase
MPRRKKFDDESVRQLKLKPGKFFPDPLSPPGHLGIRKGKKSSSFVIQARKPGGKQVWETIARTDRMTIAAARIEAAIRIKRIKSGEPAPLPPDTLRAVAANWVKRVGMAARDGKGQIEIAEKQRRINTHLLPTFGDRVFTSIKRSEAAQLFDTIEDDHGPRVADMVRVDLLVIERWFAKRADDHAMHFERMGRRSKAKQRDRALDFMPKEVRNEEHRELCAIWKAAGEADRFGAFVKLALGTAQRRSKIIEMKWTDVDLDTGKWTIPHFEDEKGVPDQLMLPPLMLDIVKAQLPPLGDSQYVFPAYRGNGFMCALAVLKRTFDAKLQKLVKDEKLPAMPPWTLHDLRRTSRSLMTKANIPFHVAEAILGHKIPGVAGIYDRDDLAKPMADALVTLAAFIERKVNPPADNVIEMTAHRPLTSLGTHNS